MRISLFRNMSRLSRRTDPSGVQASVFCIQCGGGLISRIPIGDTRERLLCPSCAYVHYENPRVLVVCLVTYGHRVLLCRRALDPAYGLWAPPAGYLEIGETVEAAAVREVFEETGVAIRVSGLVLRKVTTLTQLRQVYIHFSANAQSTACQPGAESLDAAFFAPADIPWKQLAFASIADDLSQFLIDRDPAQFSVRNTCEP